MTATFRAFLVLVALAATPVAAKPQARAKATTAAPSDGPSADARAARRAFGAVRAGNFMGGISGAGLDLGYVDGAPRQYFLHFMTGSTDLKDEIKDDEFVTLEKFEAQGVVVSASARFFFGNSFHVTGGLGVRRVGFDMHLADKAGTGRVETRADAQSVVVSLDIGNAWAWDNGLFLGADWVGYSLPLTSSFSSSVETDGTASGAINDLSEIVDDAARDLGSRPSSQFLVLSLGFMF